MGYDKLTYLERKGCVQIRRYQALECNDGINWDSSDEGWKNAQIFTFKETEYTDKNPDGESWLIGAAGFTVVNSQQYVCLDFCWIHPFWRNQNLLTNAWPIFLKKYQKFYMSTPRTHAMNSVLKKVKYQQPTK